MKISLVINCDTREGFLNQSTGIGDHGEGSLHGCRHVDFLTEGIKNKLAFFRGYELETIVCIDLHQPIPEFAQYELNKMVRHGEINKLVIKPVDRKRRHWNDLLYLDALEMATGDYVAHIDADCVLFQSHLKPVVELHLKLLEFYGYVCQPTMLLNHNMWHASTRFFMCKRSTLDIPEITRALNVSYRHEKYGTEHCPCLEFVLAYIIKQKAIYPLACHNDWMVVNWVRYYAGLLGKLNEMPYHLVQNYFETCGILGPNDIVALPI